MSNEVTHGHKVVAFFVPTRALVEQRPNLLGKKDICTKMTNHYQFILRSCFPGMVFVSVFFLVFSPKSPAFPIKNVIFFCPKFIYLRVWTFVFCSEKTYVNIYFKSVQKEVHVNSGIKMEN